MRQPLAPGLLPEMQRRKAARIGRIGVPVKIPRKLYFEKAPDVPNSPLPVLLIRSALAPNASTKARRFREAFKRNGWTGIWTDTIYDYTHFHSNAHEVLGIAEGQVTVLLGGASGRRFRLKAGDMLAIPAGVGHRRVGESRRIKGHRRLSARSISFHDEAERPDCAESKAAGYRPVLRPSRAFDPMLDR